MSRSKDNFLLMSASQHNQAVRAAGERILDIGDIILSEITPCYQGQFVQICRTTGIGEPRPVICEKYALLQDAMQELNIQSQPLDEEDQAALESSPATAAPAPASETSYLEELEKLGELRDKGIITDAEFEAKKKDLLGL